MAPFLRAIRATQSFSIANRQSFSIANRPTLLPTTLQPSSAAAASARHDGNAGRIVDMSTTATGSRENFSTIISTPSSSSLNRHVAPPNNYTPTASAGNMQALPGKPTATVPSPSILPPNNYMPAYIASLPVRPSNPTTPAPFALPLPTPNTMSNPTSNYCGYGWESAKNECFHACPSGKNDECPNGRTCHAWLDCIVATVDPAVYNVCGRNWQHASSTCSTRCFLGNDDNCPAGTTCFGGVSDCGDELPELTAEDVGLVQKSYTQEEIAVLLDEEIKKERDEEMMSDSENWWCGTSWTKMLETCSKRCETDEDCKENAWDDSPKCFRTTGGPDNCSAPGVPVRQALPPGSRWCGGTWNDMLETCSAQCESDEDCGSGKTCWGAPDTCEWIGVPVKEKSDAASLWCGKSYDDAMTSCQKACPGETNEECPTGTSCFSGSSCTEEGETIEREGYRCGKSWEDASEECGMECQSGADCESDEKCFAEVVCESELLAEMTSGMFCGVTWEGTSKNCNKRCEEDEDCPGQQWCYWVECEDEDGMNMMMLEPTTEATQASCNAEVRQCNNGQFVGRAQQLGCDFYPCPQEDVEDEDDGGDEDDNGGGGDGGDGGETGAKQPSNSSGETNLSGWGSTPLTYKCTSDGLGTCSLCQGDCNSDDDCQDGLMCFSRGSGEMTSVPGCVSGGMEDLPGMDYCYAPFPPATTTTTTTTSTTTTTTITADQNANFMSAGIIGILTVGNLEYTRECTADQPCGACEGDCDNESHCANGLLCFSRGVGSVELVPGCLGLGMAGMDYCHDPNAPIVLPPTSSPTLGGCSAEVFACPGGSGIVYRDPANKCEFAPCPTTSAASAANKLDDDATPPTPSPTTSSSPTFDASTFYCGYNLNQVNAQCAKATPCPMGSFNECDGMELCIRDTNCGSVSATSTSATDSSVISSSSTTPSEEEICDDLCLEIITSEFCPTNLDFQNCLEVGLGEMCEGDGECATDDALNNCGTYDIYVRVVCGFKTPSQGQLMRGTTSPTPGPSGSPTPLPTMAPVTEDPTMSPIRTMGPTIDALKMELAMADASAAAAKNDPSTTENNEAEGSIPISLADAIADATANSALTESALPLSQGPTSPPIKEYESNVAAGITYDRSPGEEVVTATAEEADSSGWYYGSAKADDADDAAEKSNEEWDFDSYFKGPTTRSSAATSTMSISLVSSMPILIGMVAPFFLACLS
eukprot:CAMPEP_0172297150 /NCGR_PEP_ID=MMETSP1058-20130122/274_1 /TAXON_ID=83371 /ORGANISM="Detonula confervacea, Strain CCMP 353" /LENGTH=1215 /DNA_ID=CAMNT_0013006265 /DNA_START=285 /DNA_END=3931 /DNA_ORIENTATION=+